MLNGSVNSAQVPDNRMIARAGSTAHAIDRDNEGIVINAAFNTITGPNGINGQVTTPAPREADNVLMTVTSVPDLGLDGEALSIYERGAPSYVSSAAPESLRFKTAAFTSGRFADRLGSDPGHIAIHGPVTYTNTPTGVPGSLNCFRVDEPTMGKLSDTILTNQEVRQGVLPDGTILPAGALTETDASGNLIWDADRRAEEDLRVEREGTTVDVVFDRTEFEERNGGIFANIAHTVHEKVNFSTGPNTQDFREVTLPPTTVDSIFGEIERDYSKTHNVELAWGQEEANSLAMPGTVVVRADLIEEALNELEANNLPAQEYTDYGNSTYFGITPPDGTVPSTSQLVPEHIYDRQIATVHPGEPAETTSPNEDSEPSSPSLTLPSYEQWRGED